MAHNSDRLTTLRSAMECRALDVLYVRSTSNIAWITGFERVFDTEQAHALLLDRTRCVVHSDSRYSEALERAACSTTLTIDATRQSHGAFLLSLITEACAHNDYASASSVRVGIEDSLTLAEYRVLERMCQAASISIELVELSGFVEEARQVKDAGELDAMRTAQAITDAAFARIVQWMQVGMTEREVQLQLDQYLFEEGAEGLAFDTIVATGAHASSPHAVPGETKLAQGDAVVMDFGARFAGYCSDMTRTVFMGEPSQELRQAWNVLRATNEACEALLHAGITGAAVHNRAEELLTEGGFAGRMGHSLGHSVGLDIHEAPNLSPVNNNPLQVGNVVTVEPGIYIPGAFGMRLEDYGVVTEDGYDVFTTSTHDLIVID